MKHLSLQKVNRLVSGQTLYYVDAYVDDSLELVVEMKAHLLLGKKRILPAQGMFMFFRPPTAWFKQDSWRGFLAEPKREDGYGERWFFGNRRSAMQAVEEVRSGKYPELNATLLKEAQERLKKKAEGDYWTRKLAAAETPVIGPRDRVAPIRAFGETETYFHPPYQMPKDL
jgi:hypothetical protein